MDNLEPKNISTNVPVPAQLVQAESAEWRKPDGVDVTKGVEGTKPSETGAEKRSATAVAFSPEPSSSCTSSWPKKSRLWQEQGSGTDSVRSRSELSSESESGLDTTVRAASKGPGRPPTTGKYVGLRKAERELKVLRREEAKKKAEEAMEESVRSFFKSPAPPRDVTMGEDRIFVPHDVKEALKLIRMVSAKSGNLKGTFQKALNTACDTIANYTAQSEFVIASKLEEEANKWKEASNRLETEVAKQACENIELRRRLDRLEAAGNAQPAEDALARLETRLMARVEGAIQHLPPAPILRPPLAHDLRASRELEVHSGTTSSTAVAAVPSPATTKGKGKGKGKSAALVPVVTGPASVPVPIIAPGPSKETDKQKGKKSTTDAPKTGKKKRTTNTVQPPKEPRPLPPAPASLEEPWSVVVKKGKAKKKAPPSAAPATSMRPPKKEPKIRPPKSAAVIISLTPAAVAKGLTYAKVLTAAQGKVDLTGLNIDRLKPKHAATGAPMYEVPGANSEERADSLAARLRECFSGSEDVKITRPMKFVELRVSGLDDAATPEIVATALSRVGECDEDSLKIGEVRQDRSGLGTVWAKVPVKAAQKIRAANRVLIGWVSARITVLEPRPLRCFRCLNLGHVREQCDCGVDRSNLCFRCGKPGHIARGCEAVPHCALCAAANKPAGHQIGGKACPASRNTRRPPRRRILAAYVATAQQQSASPSRAEPVAMEIAQ